MNNQDSSEPKKSLPALLAGVLLKPRSTFAHLSVHRQRSWWAPAGLVLVCTLLPLIATNAAANNAAPAVPYEAGNSLGKPMVMPRENEAMVEGSGGDFPPQEATNQFTAISLLRVGATIIGLPLSWLLWGGALFLASVFLGRSSSLAPMFRLTVWTWLPYALRGLIQAVYIWATGQPIANKGLSGYIIDAAVPQIITPGPGKLALSSILGRVDGFSVWNLALLVIGLMAFTKLPRRKAIMAILVIWAVFALLSVVPAILGGMFGSIAM